MPHGFVDHVAFSKSDESKSSRFARLSVFHDDAVCQFAPLRIKVTQSVVACFVIQSADEQFTELLRLSGVVLGLVFSHPFDRSVGEYYNF